MFGAAAQCQRQRKKRQFAAVVTRCRVGIANDEFCRGNRQNFSPTVALGEIGVTYSIRDAWWPAKRSRRSSVHTRVQRPRHPAPNRACALTIFSVGFAIDRAESCGTARLLNRRFFQASETFPSPLRSSSPSGLKSEFPRNRGCSAGQRIGFYFKARVMIDGKIAHRMRRAPNASPQREPKNQPKFREISIACSAHSYKTGNKRAHLAGCVG